MRNSLSSFAILNLNEDTNVCSNYLKNLINLGIIQKETPYGEKESRKSIHYTKLHYYLFSKTGFTKGCMEKAEKMGNVTLVSYADIIGAMRK